MIEKILFSPIGGSDPINVGHDAAWLHCCRHYKPDLTVVYLSEQMLRREKNKQMYSLTLKKLNDLIGKDIQFKPEERPDLVNPQEFEDFFDDFEAILERLNSEYPDAEILVNVSSGTTAMKACLTALYHMLPFEITLIQVDGPHDEMGLERGRRSTVSEDYDVDEGWENNLDNLDDARNRCHVLQMLQQWKRLKLMQIKTLIDQHEYSAALTLAEDDQLKGSLPENLSKLLNAAVSRMQMDLYKAGMLFSGFDFDDGKVLRAHFKELLYQGAEMLLTMEIDLQRDDVSSCLRKVTPLLLSLIAGYLLKLGFVLEDVLDERVMYIDKQKLSDKYSDVFTALGGELFKDPSFPNCIISSNNLLKILDFKYNDKTQERKNISWFRDLERKVRNEIAHKPVKMTDALFKERTGYTTDEIIKRAQETFGLLNHTLFNSTYWQSYERMNKFILDSAVIEK